jgi:hypothetical protein
MYNTKVEFPSIDRPGTDVSMGLICAVAFVGTLALFLAVFPFKGTFIRDLLMGREVVAWDRIFFQGLTIYMWAMSTANIVLKYKHIRAERRAMHRDPLPADLDTSDPVALQNVFKKMLAIPGFAKRISLTRFGRILAMWVNTRDFDRTAQYAKEEAELEAFLSDSSFRANRLFIWAMPLLGFVGTVYGVSYGIGGFAEFLRGEVTAEQMKFQVGLITEGLAVAFYTTLVGLLTAGAAAFPSLSAERREEALLGEIDEYLQDRLISRLPSARKMEFPTEQFIGIQESIDRIHNTLQIPVGDLTQAIRDGFSRMPDPQRYQAVFSRAIDEAAELINKKYGEFTIRYEQRVDELAGALAKRIEAVGDRFHEATQRMSLDLQARNQEITVQGQRQSELFASTRDESLRALDALRKAAEDFAARLKQNTDGLSTQVDRLSAMATGIDTLLRATEAMQKTLTALSSSDDFRKTMTTLDRHLEDSRDVLKKFARPRTILLEERPVASRTGSV